MFRTVLIRARPRNRNTLILTEMEVLVLLRKHLAAGGIEMSGNQPFNGKNSTVFVLVCLFGGLTALSSNEAKSSDERIDIWFRSISIGICGVIYEIMVWKSTKLHEFLNHLADTVNERLTNSKARKLYTEMSQNIEKWTNILDFACFKITLVLCVLPASVVSFIKYFFTDLGNLAFELPGPMWLPFDWRNPFGYVIAGFIQYMLNLRMMVAVECLVIFEFETFSMLFPLTKDVRNMLKTINRKAKLKRKQPQIGNLFLQLIQFHSKLIQLVHDYSEFSSMIFGILLSWSLAGICTMMILLNMKMGTIDSLEIIVMSIIAFWTFAGTFGICEFGQQLSGTFEEISELYNELAWYSFPWETQRMLITQLSFVQQSVELSCVFGTISCSRITFKDVINRSYSWFMILHRVDK